MAPQHPSVQSSVIDKFRKMKVKNRQDFFVHPSYNTERRLLQSLSMGLVDEAERALDEINRQPRARLAPDPIRSLKNSLIASCTLFTRAIIEGGVHPENAYSLSDVFIWQIEETKDAKSLERLEYDMLHAFARALREERQPVSNAIVNRTVAFIHDEILNDLSLERIAAHVSVHPAYLSNLFKKETGMTVTEYITRTRVEDSKYFLTHSDLPILDIAVLLGFCNQSYYARQFKRYVSMTPREYRNKYRGGVGV
jgi:YesN/AraC family two-component response regulator